MGTWKCMLSLSQPKEAGVFCAYCLHIITSLQRASRVAWSPWPPGIYSLRSVIQLIQTMPIYRQERATASYSDGLGMLPEACRARELWEEMSWPLESVHGVCNCYAHYFSSAWLNIFSLTCQYKEQFCVFLTYVRRNWY